ncbi:4-hydroxyphenyl-beta-ketoacyl-CoA hydrolase [soil metagenome]
MIDMHTHIGTGEHMSDDFIADMTRGWAEVGDLGVSTTDHWEVVKGLDAAVVLAIDAPASGYVVPNELVADYVAEHPDKLVGFASVDPARPDALDRLHVAVEELGLRGLKIGPIYQHIDPRDERMINLLSEAVRLDLPVLCHQGTTFVRSAPLAFARPFLLDEVAARLPDLRLYIAHLGHPWCEETMAVIRKHPNLYADVSALQTRPMQLYMALTAAVEYRVTHKLLFGSDFPFGSPTLMADALRAVCRLTDGTGLPPIPEAIVEEIIERDGLAVMGLSLGAAA